MTLIYKETIPPIIKNSTIVLESLYSVLFFSKRSLRGLLTPNFFLVQQRASIINTSGAIHLLEP
jgi:hypothetical protein